MTRLVADLCIIGAGSGGLSLAAGAAQLGARVVLIEGAEMGGDCLNAGCVPSKALLAAAHAAQAQRQGFAGVAPHPPAVDFAAVQDHIAATIAAIAPMDSQARFEALGVTVLRAWARFVSPREVEAGGHIIRARRFVIATGATAVLPPVPGLDTLPYLTNETLFSRRERPDHLLVLGGGYVGVEMAQAQRRLGAAVTLIQRSTILPGEDDEARAHLRAALLAEGVAVCEGRSIVRLRRQGGGIEAVLDDGAVIAASHLLVATGRRPALARLNLDAAGVAFSERGVRVGPNLRSTNRRIYAVGDAAGGAQFTHVAGAHAGVVIRQVLFGLPARAETRHVPRVLYTSPELAQIGLTEAEARARHGAALQVIRQEFTHNDRARTEAATNGFLKLMLVKSRPVGVTIVGPQAGELIGLWALMLHARLPLTRLAGAILPYPTRNEISRRAAGACLSARLFDNAGVKRLVRLVQRLLP